MGWQPTDKVSERAPNTGVSGILFPKPEHVSGIKFPIHRAYGDFFRRLLVNCANRRNGRAVFLRILGVGVIHLDDSY